MAALSTSSNTQPSGTLSADENGDIGYVRFKCFKEGSKLRVKVISKGYNNSCNCQFPRAIRKDGCEYDAPATSVTMRRSPGGKYFYHVAPKSVRMVEGGSGNNASGAGATGDEKISVAVYKMEECVICYDSAPERVFIPCGHFCSCLECASSILKCGGASSKCPLCRAPIQQSIGIDQLQT